MKETRDQSVRSCTFILECNTGGKKKKNIYIYIFLYIYIYICVYVRERESIKFSILLHQLLHHGGSGTVSCCYGDESPR